MSERTFGSILGELIYQKRKAAGLTQMQLAEDAFGTSGKTRRISELENGSVADPHPKTIDPIISILKISESELERCAKEGGSRPDSDLDRAYREARNLIDAIARQFEHSNPNATLADLDDFLRAKAKEWVEFKKKIESLDAPENSLSNLKRSAEEALANGDFDEVDRLLADAEDLQQEARTLTQIRKQAELRILRGDNSLMRGDSAGASNFYLGAVEFFRPFDELEMIEAIDSLAGRVYESGRRSLEPSFQVATQLLERALTVNIVQQRADQRARINYKLSLVYRSAVEASSVDEAAELLEKSILAGRRALEDSLLCGKVYEIASARIALGNCVFDKHRRSDSSVSAKEAEALFRKAVEELEGSDVSIGDKEYVRLLAHAYNSLGNTLLHRRHGKKSKRNKISAKEIEEALQIYARAIERSEASDSNDAWAAAKINRGNVLVTKAMQDGLTQGSREFLLIQAISSFMAAIETYPAVLFPVPFAEAHLYLASTLFEFAKILDFASAEIYLMRAIASFEAAAEVFTEERSPLRFAEIQVRIGSIFFIHSRVGGDVAVADLERSAEHYEVALPLLSAEQDRLRACNDALKAVKERLAELNSSNSKSV